MLAHLDMDSESLKGYKTYIISGAAILYALSGAIAGYHDWNYAITVILSAGGLSTMAAKFNRSLNPPEEKSIEVPPEQ